jgi:hypothetical protein
MRKTILLGLVISIIFLIISMLQDKLKLDEELEYETKVVYPLGVNRAQYDEIWYSDEDYDE